MPRAFPAEIKEEESGRCRGLYDQERKIGDKKHSMSEQAFVPRPNSHHRTSSDVNSQPISPRNNDISVTPVTCLSPTTSPNKELRHLLYRNEQHDTRPAERGTHTTSTGDNPTSYCHDMKKRSKPRSTAISPQRTIDVTDTNALPGLITSTMAQEREAGQTDSAPTTSISVPETAVQAASTEIRSAQPTPSRTLGVHNILNPSEAQAIAHSPTTVPRTSSRENAGMDMGESRTLPRTRPSSASSPQIGSASSASGNHLGRAQQSHPQPPPGFQVGSGSGGGRLHGPSNFAPGSYGSGYGQSASTDSGQAPNTSKSPGMGFVPLSGATGSDQESSPRLGHSHTNPSLGSQPRRILTPKSPRRTSLGRGIPGMGTSGSQHALFPGGAGAPPVPPLPPNRLQQSMSAPNIGPGSGSGSGSAQMAGSVPGSYFPLHAAPGPPPSMMTGESPQRSYAKPYYPSEGGRQGPGHGDNHGPSGQALEPYQHHHDHNQQQQQQQPQQEAQQTSRLPFPPGTRQGGFVTTTTPNRTVSASNANTSSSEGSWEGHVKATGGPGGIIGGGRSVSIAEGQQFITITPSYGDEIHVPVDVHQASKQADEKRLRNAGASARFRARKKEKDREAQIGIQRLEALNRDLQKRNQELEAQRDFYRNERNRLRHIMSQSPSMREYIDSGPPSPASTSLSGPSYGAEGSPMTGSNVQPASAQHLQAPPQQQQPQPQPRLHPQHLPQHQLYTQHPQHPHQPQRQITPTHTPGPLYPPMTTAPEFSGPPPAHLPGASDSAVGVERPSQRRRTDSGPNIEYYTPSYTTSAPPPPILPSSLPPPIAPAASSSFHSMSPSPLSGSPSNPRLPPLRLDTPGSNPSSVGIGGGMGTGPPTPEPTHGSASALPVPQQYPPATTASSTYNRSYDTAGWAADAPASHPQHQPPDSKFQR